jgi:hypothetical protein
MVPDAPGRFSTITGKSHFKVSLGAKSLANMSGPAPGVKGTNNLTGRLSPIWAQDSGLAAKAKDALD